MENGMTTLSSPSSSLVRVSCSLVAGKGEQLGVSEWRFSDLLLSASFEAARSLSSCRSVATAGKVVSTTTATTKAHLGDDVVDGHCDGVYEFVPPQIKGRDKETSKEGGLADDDGNEMQREGFIPRLTLCH